MYVCRGCIYRKACGDNSRQKTCDGRKTLSEFRREMKNSCNPDCQYRRNCRIFHGVYFDSEKNPNTCREMAKSTTAW